MTCCHIPFKMTAEVGDLLLVWINHLQQAVVAVVSPLRNIGCNSPVGPDKRAASFRVFRQNLFLHKNIHL